MRRAVLITRDLASVSPAASFPGKRRLGRWADLRVCQLRPSSRISLPAPAETYFTSEQLWGMMWDRDWRVP